MNVSGGMIVEALEAGPFLSDKCGFTTGYNGVFGCWCVSKVMPSIADYAVTGLYFSELE